MPPGTKRQRSRRTWRAYGKHVAKHGARGAAGGALAGAVYGGFLMNRRRVMGPTMHRLAAAGVMGAMGAVAGASAGAGSHLF